MNLGFKTEEFGKHLMIFFDKEVPGWKRFASELVNDRVVLESPNLRKMFEEKGDVIVYEVYHLYKAVDKLMNGYRKTKISSHLTFLHSGVFSDGEEGELYLTYGHLHQKPIGEAFTVLNNQCYFVLSDLNTKETFIIRMKKGNSILVHPRFLHRIVSFKKDCLIIDFVPDKAGHNYGAVKNKGFPFHLFLKRGKLHVVKNPRYKGGKVKIINSYRAGTNPLRLFENNPMKLKEILEDPDKHKNLYFGRN